MADPTVTSLLQSRGRALTRPPILGERVTEELRQMIISGELPMETHLVEAQLSELFALSRGPIRDALRQLEKEGLVESRRRGVFVLGLTAADINELYQLREALEYKVLELCSELEDPDTTEIRSHLARMREAADASDSNAFSRADLDFHSAFYILAGNRRILDVWAQYRPTYEMMMTIANVHPIDLDPIYADHVALHELTMSGALDELGQRLQSHLAASKSRLLAGHARLSEVRKSNR